MTNGRGADVVIETSGAGPAIASAIRMTKKYGKLCAIGLGADESRIPWKQIVMHSITVVGCMSSGYSAWDKALGLMNKHRDELSCLITHRVSLDEWQETFEALLAEKGIKAIFHP